MLSKKMEAMLVDVPQFGFAISLSGPRCNSRPKKEFAHAHRSADYSGLGVIRSVADLALQPFLGLLPEWRVGNSPHHRNHLDVAVRPGGPLDRPDRCASCAL